MIKKQKHGGGTLMLHGMPSINSEMNPTLSCLRISIYFIFTKKGGGGKEIAIF